MMAPDSHSVMPVLGSSMAGTRPLMLIFSKGSFFRSAKSMIFMSYGMSSSAKMMATFHGFGPCNSEAVSWVVRGNQIA